MKAVMKGVITRLHKYDDDGTSVQDFAVLVQPDPYLNDNAELMKHWSENYIDVVITLEAGLKKE